jgi:hypothetical protein
MFDQAGCWLFAVQQGRWHPWQDPNAFSAIMNHLLIIHIDNRSTYLQPLLLKQKFTQSSQVNPAITPYLNIFQSLTTRLLDKSYLPLIQKLKSYKQKPSW